MNRSDSMDKTSQLELNSEMIPTQELLKAQRKQAYEEAKAQRREDKRLAKTAKAQDKEKARAERDQALWQALKKGHEVPSE